MKEGFKFLLSALDTKKSVHTIEYALQWIREQNQKTKVNLEHIEFTSMRKWKIDENSISHESGRFFSIKGIKVSTDWFAQTNTMWCQPIIHQPEIGYLGFIVKEINGVFHFLVQAKIEPGNINCVQLSPTLQATKSNYQTVHKGRTPDYLEYFQQANKEAILLDQLQSEQGARFLKKRNRNIIIHVKEPVETKPNFIWLTLNQIKELMSIDNTVNMDTRTVLSGISYGSYSEEVLDYLGTEYKLSEFGKALLRNSKAEKIDIFDILAKLTHLKSYYELNVEIIPINQLVDWQISTKSITHKDNRYFKVIPMRVSIENREVVSWDQPMISPQQCGICALICFQKGRQLHFLLQAKLECGNHDIIEYAPTVQTLTGNYKEVMPESIPFLDYILNINEEKIIFDSLQSEEGGRFFQEQNRNMVIFCDLSELGNITENYHSVSFIEIQELIKFNNILNIQVRNLISSLKLV